MSIRIPILDTLAAASPALFNPSPPEAAADDPVPTSASAAPSEPAALAPYDPVAWRDQQQGHVAALSALAQHHLIMSGALAQLSADPATTIGANAPGLTGAYLDQYDQISRQLIAALPDRASRASLAAQLSDSRAAAARNVLALEARRNLQERERGFTDGVATLARDLARQPQLLEARLAFVDRYMITVAGDPQSGGQPSFKARMRASLVDAAVQAQLARDPHGMLAALRARAGENPTPEAQYAADAQDLAQGAAQTQETAQAPGITATQGTTQAQNPIAANTTTPPATPSTLADPAANHPVVRPLSTEEVAAYLPQALSATYRADSNYRAGVLQRAFTASRQYMASGSATDAPAQKEFTRALGAEQGARAYAQLQQSAAAGRLRQQMLPLPDAQLQRTLDQAWQASTSNTQSPKAAPSPAAPATPGAPAPSDSATTPTSTDASALLDQVILQIRQQRAADPVQSALDTRAYGVRPIDFTPGATAGLGPALRARAVSADLIARDYRVPLAVLTHAETQQLARTLQTLPAAGQRGLLQKIIEDLADPALLDTAMRQISADAPVPALAGLYLARDLVQAPPPDQRAWGSGTPNVPDLLLRGQALLAANYGAAGTPYALPSDTLLRQAFARYTGDAYAAEPGKAELYLKAAKAVYAALDPWNNQDPAYDPGRWLRAVGLATEGNVVPQTPDMGTGLVPTDVPAGTNALATEGSDEGPFLTQFAAGSHLRTDVSEAGAADTSPRKKPRETYSYLTKDQVQALDQMLLAAQANGASLEEQRAIFDDFKAVALFQAAVQPLKNTDSYTRDFRETNIDYHAKLKAQGPIAGEAETYFSEKAEATRRPFWLDVLGRYGDATRASGSTGAGQLVGSAATVLGNIAVSHILGLPSDSRPPGKSNSADHNDPKPLFHIEVDGVRYPLYSRADAAKLSPGSGLAFTFEGRDQREPSARANAPQAFEAGTSGAMSDPVTGLRIVPLLRYTNDVTYGQNVKRMDGFEGTHVISLIDAKHNFDSMNDGRKSNFDMQRAIKAWQDNPQFKVIIETPTQSQAERMEGKLDKGFKIKPGGGFGSRKR